MLIYVRFIIYLFMPSLNPVIGMYIYSLFRRKHQYTSKKEKESYAQKGKKEWVLEQNVKRRCWKKWCKLRQKKIGTKVTFDVGRTTRKKKMPWASAILLALSEMKM